MQGSGLHSFTTKPESGESYPREDGKEGREGERGRGETGGPNTTDWVPHV